MNEEAGSAFALEDVTRRFADSEETLARAREQLQGLIRAEESSTASAASLQEAASSVGAFVQRADSLLGELEQAQRQAREVLEAGAKFLDGTELRELKQTVEELTKSLQDRLASIQERVANVDAANARADAAEAELQRIKESLSARQVRKLGLE